MIAADGRASALRKLAGILRVSVDDDRRLARLDDDGGRAPAPQAPDPRLPDPVQRLAFSTAGFNLTFSDWV